MKNLIIILILLFLYSSNYIFYNKVNNLNTEVIKLSNTIEENNKIINLKISDDNKYLYINDINNDYNHIIEKLNNFEHIDFLIAISDAYGFDWKLFIVQIFYESNFKPNAISNSGAKGLMQLTKWTYSEDADPMNEIHNIFIGISYFDFLYNKFDDIKDKNERIKFTLAAYHDGIGKIETIRTKLKKLDKNSNNYDNLKEFLSNECIKYVDNICITYKNI